ncbi:hypothetical protein HMPREF1863_01474 [Aedoeadaptatus coxii]|uniref:Uncharacterized protein n=1 Tax=Aedoeadaptatus coxii TaxID=755172 RepID=A0A134AC40_9FIRM|nr:hypothetical protein HMPREF1863_01474 [Peptoniphilus coxii]
MNGMAIDDKLSQETHRVGFEGKVVSFIRSSIENNNIVFINEK